MKKIIPVLFLLCFHLSLFSQSQSGYSHSTATEFFQNQQFEQAVQYLKANSRANDIQYDLDMGYAQYMTENYVAAIENYLNAISKDSTNIPANLLLAKSFSFRNENENSLKYFKKLTELQPGNLLNWLNTGSGFLRIRETDSAFRYFEQAYLINPKSASAIIQYSNALFLKKQYKKAELVLDDFLKTDTTEQSVISRKIELSYRDERYIDVLFWGRKLLRDEALTPVAHTKTAFAYLNMKKPDSAIRVCEQLEEWNMASESSLYCAALAYKAKKDYVRSNSFLDECLKFNLLKEAKIYFRSKGENYQYTGNFEKAVAQYDSSFYIFHDPIDLYLAGSIYDQQLNNKQKAVSYYKRYLVQKKKPEDETDRKLLEYISGYLKANPK